MYTVHSLNTGLTPAHQCQHVLDHGHTAAAYHQGAGAGAGGEGVPGGGVVSAAQHHEGAGEPQQDPAAPHL